VNAALELDGATAEQSAAQERSDRGVLYCFLAVRAVHLAQGLICFVSAGRSYRSRRRAAAVLGVAAAESAWLALRGWREGEIDATAAGVDACASTAGLVALASCLEPDDRTASMNWMMPYSVGGCLALGVGLPGPVGVAATTGVAATYVVTVRDSIRPGGARAAAAVANAASYAGFYAVSRAVDVFLKRTTAQLDEARRHAIARGERLAAERERNRQHRLLHDTALQVLEAIGQGWLSPDAAKARALEAASELRQALRGGDTAGRPAGLSAMLEVLVTQFGNEGLAVELVSDVAEREPTLQVASALRDATREALTNVVKHAGTDRAVVHVSVNEGGAIVTVRDHGCGFDPHSASDGFGIPESVAARMVEVGGDAEIWSQPGRGTRVRVRGPV
jgi:signal transduction histidine kinase